METKNLYEKLQDAKKAVQATLDNSRCNVDCKGLVYWAGEVERLREEIQKTL